MPGLTEHFVLEQAEDGALARIHKHPCNFQLLEYSMCEDCAEVKYRQLVEKVPDRWQVHIGLDGDQLVAQPRLLHPLNALQLLPLALPLDLRIQR